MDALEYLDEMNESGRIQYDDYVNLHNAVSLEAVKAETTTEWNAVRQDATGELWDVYEPFDSREDAERVAAEWRSNNETGDDPVVVVERTKGVAPGEWQIVSSEVKRG